MSEAKESEINRKLEEPYECPISLLDVEDPVTLPCGHTFEKTAIEQWIEEQQKKGKELCLCPAGCGKPIPKATAFGTDLMLRRALGDITALKKNLAQEQSSKKAVRQNNWGLQAKLQESENHATALESQLAAANTQVEQAQQKAKKTEQELQDLRSTSEATIAKLTQAEHTAQQTITTQQATIDAQQDEIAALKAALAASQQENTKLKEEKTIREEENAAPPSPIPPEPQAAEIPAPTPAEPTPQPKAQTVSVEDAKDGSLDKDRQEKLIYSLTCIFKADVNQDDLTTTRGVLKALDITDLTSLPTWLAQSETLKTAPETRRKLRAFALVERGNRHRIGINAPQDDCEAVRCFTAASDDPAGQFALGLHYLDGRGVEKDTARAITFFKQSAQNEEEPNPGAQCMLAWLYLDKMGVDTSTHLNARDTLLHLTEQHGVADALLTLGRFAVGHDTSVWGNLDSADYNKRAAHLYRLAYLHGSVKIKGTLQSFYNKGLGLAPDLCKAVKSEDLSEVTHYLKNLYDQLDIAPSMSVIDDAQCQIEGMINSEMLSDNDSLFIHTALQQAHAALFPADSLQTQSEEKEERAAPSVSSSAAAPADEPPFEYDKTLDDILRAKDGKERFAHYQNKFLLANFKSASHGDKTVLSKLEQSFTNMIRQIRQTKGISKTNIKHYEKEASDNYLPAMLSGISEDGDAVRLKAYLKESFPYHLNDLAGFGKSVMSNIEKVCAAPVAKVHGQAVLKRNKAEYIKGLAEAYCECGLAYENAGKPELAVQFYACISGKVCSSLKGRHHLARCYENGIGVAQNLQTAIDTLEPITKKETEVEAKEKQTTTAYLAKLKAALAAQRAAAQEAAENKDEKAEDKPQTFIKDLINDFIINVFENNLGTKCILLNSYSLKALDNLIKYLQHAQIPELAKKPEIKKMLYSAAMFERGERYQEGDEGDGGSPKNDREAVNCFIAADDYPGAQFALAIHYLDGRGVEQDTARATALFKRAAQNKRGPDSNAQCMLACLYLDKTGVDTTFNLAARKKLLESTEETDDIAIALYNLALTCNHHGPGNTMWRDAPGSEHLNDEIRTVALHKLAFIYGAPQAKAQLQSFYNQGVAGGLDISLFSAVERGDLAALMKYLADTCEVLGMKRSDPRSVTVIDDALCQIEGMKVKKLISSDRKNAMECANRARQILQQERAKLLPAAPKKQGVLPGKRQAQKHIAAVGPAPQAASPN